MNDIFGKISSRSFTKVHKVNQSLKNSKYDIIKQFFRLSNIHVNLHSQPMQNVS